MGVRACVRECVRARASVCVRASCTSSQHGHLLQMHAVFLHVEHGGCGGGAQAGVCRGGTGAVAVAGFVAVTVTVAGRGAGEVVGAVAGV